MKTYVLIYEGFVQFEVVLANNFMKTKGDIITVGKDMNEVLSHEGFKTIPHKTIDDIDIEEVDLFIIPGGFPDILINNTKLHKLLKELNSKNKVIGAICAAPIHLAKAGILNGRNFTTTLPVEEFYEFNECNFKNRDIVVDKNIVTAKANAYVDFAIKLGELMDIYENEEDLEETIRYFKYHEDTHQDKK